jgi:hypothetical protein
VWVVEIYKVTLHIFLFHFNQIFFFTYLLAIYAALKFTLVRGLLVKFKYLVTHLS